MFSENIEKRNFNRRVDLEGLDWEDNWEEEVRRQGGKRSRQFNLTSQIEDYIKSKY